MTNKERAKLDWLVDNYQKCVKAHKQRDWKKMYTALCWLGHDIEDLINEDPKSYIHLEIKDIWAANPDEL